MSDSKVVILGGKSIPLPKRAAMQVIPFIHASIPEQETWPDPDTKVGSAKTAYKCAQGRFKWGYTE